jgi:hypothetical protein
MGTVILSLLWLTGSGGLADQVINATAVLMTGGFLAFTLGTNRSAFTRAAWSVLFAAGAVILWSVVWGIGWIDIELALTRQWWELCRNMLITARAMNMSADAQGFIERMADAGRPFARLFPARLVVSGILGLVLAQAWHQRVSGRLIGRKVERFVTFRFTDHLIWLVILAVAVLLVPAMHFFQQLADRSDAGAVLLYTLHYWEPLAGNLLAVCGALYVARGAAVLRRMLRPKPAMILAVVATIFLLPFAVAGLAALGVADTWIDFRGRIDAQVQPGRNL